MDAEIKVARWSLAVVKVDTDAVYAGRHGERDVKMCFVLRSLTSPVVPDPLLRKAPGVRAKRTKHRLQRFMMSKPAPQPNSSEIPDPNKALGITKTNLSLPGEQIA